MLETVELGKNVRIDIFRSSLKTCWLQTQNEYNYWFDTFPYEIRDTVIFKDGKKMGGHFVITESKNKLLE